ncbi:divalent-cation tolerance protein CutA [Arenimonas sp.]|uniref:divalent-cation tolerance protein CutA n=1 Tax=Arenimonas sp. TaxID=1872635 RepID=UPI0039E588D7
MPALLVTCTCPDKPAALTLARDLVELRLAACVQVLPGLHSIYRWEGRVEDAEEVLLLIKTWDDRMQALTEAIGERHPYELPEIIALQAAGGLAPYLQWVQDETRPENTEISE